MVLSGRRPWWLLLVPLALGHGACTRKSLVGASDGSADASAKDTTGAIAPPDPDPVVDLLHTVDATVAVSSKVDNPHDYPEHLVDGKPETAWNGKTGDLTGWIAFRVPKTARVARIELTSGYDRVSREGDLFTMNYRIKKVRISREGQVLREASLDVDKRALQAIDIDAAGGDFKVEIVETVPGTQRTWRELTVSEFRVWGRAGGAPENPTHIPKMAIGGLDGGPSPKPVSNTDPVRGPFATVGELCVAYDKVMTPLIDAKFTDSDYPGKIPGPHCVAKGAPEGFSSRSFERGPFKDARFVRGDDVERESSVLLLATEAGWFRTDVAAWTHYHRDPGCLHGRSNLFEDVQLSKASTGQEIAVIRLVERDVQWAQMDPRLDGAATRELGYACRADVRSAVSCEGPKLLATAHEPLPTNWDPSQGAFFAIHVETIPWVGRKKAFIGPAGDLRAE